MRRPKRLFALGVLALTVLAVAGAYQSTKSQAAIQIAPSNPFREPQPTPPLSPPERARFTLPYQRGADLRNRIDPTASAVTILQKGAGGLVVAPPEGMDLEEFMTRRHDAAALVTIVRKDGYLTPEADWINSDVTAQVLDVLKPDPHGSIAQNGLISLSAGDGDIQIGATRVSAIRMWAEPLRTEATYLVFLQQSKDGRLVTFPTSTLRIEADRVDGLTEYTKRAFQGRSSSAVIEAVRSSRLLPRP